MVSRISSINSHPNTSLRGFAFFEAMGLVGSINSFKGFSVFSYEPGSKLVVLGMVIPPLIGNPYNGYINPYYWVDDHPLLYGNNGSLDPSTYVFSGVLIYPLVN